MNYPRTTLSIIGITILLGSALLYKLFVSDSYGNITTFEACKKAGFVVTESDPRKCITPESVVFIEGEDTPFMQATSTPDVSGNNHQDEIKNINIVAGQKITSPITITGEARLWYFEASFPIEILDGNGKRLTAGPATAQGDWMVTTFVPFTATLSFETPTTSTGTVILRNDNPSGLPELQKEVRIPVTFETKERTVTLFYYNSEKDKDMSGNILCTAQGLVAVTRTIPFTKTPITDVVRLFLRGELTNDEKSQGITTEYTMSGIELSSINLSQQGNLTLVLNDPQSKTIGGSCRTAVLRAQLDATLKTFEDVKTITILPEELFQP